MSESIPLPADSRAWIKCSERMPPYGRTVLVYSGSWVTTGEFRRTDKDGHWWQVGCHYDKNFQDVTHWMPLPEPPK